MKSKMKKKKIDIIFFVLGKSFSALLNGFFDIWTGGKKREVFYDIETYKPELKTLEENVDLIKAEMNSILKDVDSIPAYNELDSNQNYIAATINKNKKWSVFPLYLFGLDLTKSSEMCPETTKLLNDIPNLYQAFFSILEPGKSIPAHSGPYRGYLRYHLGLKVPTQKAPYIRVHDTKYTWKEDEGVLFDDSWDHEVVNNSEEYRIVLVVDVFRPLPTLPNFINKSISKLTKHTYGKQVLSNLNSLYKNTQLANA